MTTPRKLALTGAGLLAVMLLAPAYAHNVNRDIMVGAGSQTGGQSSVNGSITVETGAIVDGSLETVNGSIRVGDNVSLRDASTVNGTVRIGSGSKADDLESVNGAIQVGDNVTLDGSIDVVNGRITLGNGCRVADNVSNVNGEIRLTATEVGGNVSTVNGDVWLENGSTIHGDLVVEKPGGWGWKHNNRPTIVIGPNSRVEGELVLHREVELFISDTASVGGVSGEMGMEDAVRFSGTRP